MDDELLQQIKELREQGLKIKEIAKKLKVSTATVDRALAKLKKMAQINPSPVTAVQPIDEGRLREIVREEINGKKGKDASDFPLVLKTGKGQEVIAPEGILKHYLLADGDPGMWMFKGMMMLRAAQLMVMSDVEIMKGQAEAQAAAIKPILDIMEKAREDMDAAAERAQHSSEEVAQVAAAGAAARAMVHIDERFNELKQQKADIATVQDPMKGLMARTMETMMERMNAMLVGAPVGPTPGMVDERVKK